MLGWSRVLYVGDSLAAETQDTLGSVLGATGRATLSVSTFPGMALCDYLDVNPSGTPAAMPAEAHLRARVAADKPNLVALQFWGNAMTPCIQANALGSEGAAAPRCRQPSCATERASPSTPSSSSGCDQRQSEQQ